MISNNLRAMSKIDDEYVSYLFFTCKVSMQ